MLNKKIPTILAIIIIIVLAGGGLIYQYLKSKELTMRDVNLQQFFMRSMWGICKEKIDIYKDCGSPMNITEEERKCLEEFSPDPVKGTKYIWDGKKYEKSWWEEAGDAEKILCMDHAISNVVYYDFDNDGKEEAVVSEYMGGTGGNDTFTVYKLLDSGRIINYPISDGKFSREVLYKESRGHFSFRLKQNKIFECFPLYKESDPNCCPTGGVRCVIFHFDKTSQKFVIEGFQDYINYPTDL